MDNLTHTLIGVTVANAGLKQRFGRGTTLALAIASNITDMDVFWGFVHDGPSFAYRRMLTHAVFGMPFIAAAGAAIHRRFFPNLSFNQCFGLYALGMVLHVLFDLFNSYGVVLFYPVSRARYELAWVFIIDLALWFFLLAPIFLSLTRARAAQLAPLSRVALRCLVVYILACAAFHGRSVRALRAQAEAEGVRPTFLYAFPEPFGPQRFRGVLRDGDAYRVYGINAVTGEARLRRTVDTRNGDPAVAKILETKMGATIGWFAKAPVWTPAGSAGGAERWRVYDLRFDMSALGRGNPFAYGFDVAPTGVAFLGAVPAAEERP